jgi:hypothetical protein
VEPSLALIESCPNASSPEHVFRSSKGNQADKAFLSKVASKTAPDGFDIIIDDASHIGELTKTSFWHLFDHHLKPGGLYAIEDWGTGYLDDFTDGRKFQPRISIRARVRSLGKNFAFAVDTAWECGNLFVPLEAGLHYFGVRSTYILGLQIGLNFVPATKTETRDGEQAVILSARDRAFFVVKM